MPNEKNLQEIIKIPIEQLKFDSKNPRIPTDIDGSNDNEVIEYLLADANIDDLMKSLLSQGYFEGEPLLVCPSDDGTYIVVEGNRRLGALKLINGFPPPRKQNTIKAILQEADKEIRKVPCIVYPRREDILGYLGYRHITGIKEWDHLAKARYLKQLYDKTNNEPMYQGADSVEIYKVLAKNIGSKYPSVENLLRGLKVLTFADEVGVLDNIGKSPNDIHFSLLTTALNHNSIENFVKSKKSVDLSDENINAENTQNLLSWLYGDREKNKIVKESREITKLAKVIENEESLKYLISHQTESDILNTSFALAGGLVEGFEEGLNKISSTLSYLRDLLNQVSDSLDQGHINGLENISKDSRTLYASAKTLMEDGE